MHYLINKEDSTARKHVVSRRHRRPRKLSMQDERKLLRHMKDLRHRQVTTGNHIKRRIGLAQHCPMRNWYLRDCRMFCRLHSKGWGRFSHHFEGPTIMILWYLPQPFSKSSFTEVLKELSTSPLLWRASLAHWSQRPLQPGTQSLSLASSSASFAVPLGTSSSYRLLHLHLWSCRQTSCVQVCWPCWLR